MINEAGLLALATKYKLEAEWVENMGYSWTNAAGVQASVFCKEGAADEVAIGIGVHGMVRFKELDELERYLLEIRFVTAPGEFRRGFFIPMNW